MADTWDLAPSKDSATSGSWIKTEKRSICIVCGWWAFIRACLFWCVCHEYRMSQHIYGQFKQNQRPCLQISSDGSYFMTVTHFICFNNMAITVFVLKGGLIQYTAPRQILSAEQESRSLLICNDGEHFEKVKQQHSNCLLLVKLVLTT